MRTPRRLIGTFIAVAGADRRGSGIRVGDDGLGDGSPHRHHRRVPTATSTSRSTSDPPARTSRTSPSGSLRELRATRVRPRCARRPSSTPPSAGNDGCPADTQVGSVVANATITVVALPVTLNVSGKLYNLTPHPGEPARFGIVLQPGNLLGALTLPLPPVILESGAALRQSDFGLDTVINDIPNSTSGLPTHINSQTITLFGNPADHGVPGTPKPFMRNPTSCTAKVTTFTASPHAPATGTATGSSPPFTPTNCGALDFSPSFTATGGRRRTGQPDDRRDLDRPGLGEAGLLNAHVFVPPDLAPNTLTDLLSHRCPPPDFQAGTCPDNTVVGNAVAASPLLSQPLTGQVHLVDNGRPASEHRPRPARAAPPAAPGQPESGQVGDLRGRGARPARHPDLALPARLHQPTGPADREPQPLPGTPARVPRRLRRLQRRHLVRRLNGDRPGPHVEPTPASHKCKKAQEEAQEASSPRRRGQEEAQEAKKRSCKKKKHHKKKHRR